MIKKSLLTGLLAVFIASPAMADPKPWIWSWWPGHYDRLDFSKRYMKDSKDAHENQWDREKWNPDVWIQQKKGGIELINGFYEAGILVDQTISDEIPYLHVGPNFYKLGGYDQQRVIQSVDEVYEITNIETDDMFYIYDDRKGDIIGLYTKNGLQMR